MRETVQKNFELAQENLAKMQKEMNTQRESFETERQRLQSASTKNSEQLCLQESQILRYETKCQNLEQMLNATKVLRQQIEDGNETRRVLEA